MDNYIVLGPSIVEASNSRLNDVMPSNSSQTRKRLRPTSHELSIVLADHQDYRSTLAERSREFGVFFVFFFCFLIFFINAFLTFTYKIEIKKKKKERKRHTHSHSQAYIVQIEEHKAKHTQSYDSNGYS